jgi:putative endopeptidase
MVFLYTFFNIIFGAQAKLGGKVLDKNMPDDRFSLKYIDWNVDPFEDFYSFANGNWIKRHNIPPNKTELSTFYMLNDSNLAKLHYLVELHRKKRRRNAKEKIVGDFYASYMNLKAIEEKKFKPIDKIIKAVMNLNDKRNLPELIAYLYNNGVSTFVDLFSESDKKNSSIYALYLWQKGIMLPNRSYYIEKRFEKIREEYRKHIEKMLSLYGFDEKDSMAASIISIETELAKAMVKKEDERNEIKSYNKTSIEELGKYKNLKLQEILSKLGLTTLHYAIVGQPNYIKSLDLILKNSNINELKAYLAWCVIHTYAPLLHRAVVVEHFRFFGTILSGQREIEPRWKRGIYRINHLIGDALGYLYVKKYFSARTMKNVEKLLESVKKSFRERLKNNRWMTEKTKKLALEKLDAMEFKIGYPKHFRDYSTLNISRNDLVGNVIRAYKFELDRQLSRVGKKVDKEEWDINTSEVNAYYDNSKNQVVIPAGILQPPFFDANADPAVNLGGIGGIIGHEITHGFDDQGRLFDKNGNLNNWWAKKDMEQFIRASRGIEKLYGSINVLPGLKINGKLTIGENIADLGGISIAYSALSAQHALNKKIENLTEEQRFFIAWAQIWKNIITKKAIELRIYVDPHSPQSVRGLIPVVSHPAFEHTFKPLSKYAKPKQQYKDVNIW